MNLTHLGDALDHWKGSLLKRFLSENLLQDFRVDAMLSDRADWTERDLGPPSRVATQIRFSSGAASVREPSAP
jgi:hypothetical protein